MKKKDALNSQEKIINAAIIEFAENGYGGARVDRIAEIAGLNKAMIYYHYKSKEILYESILKDFTARVIASISSVAVQGDEPKQQLFSILESYADFINGLDKNFLRLFLREISGGGEFFKKIAISNLIIPAFEIIEPIFKKAVKKGEIRDVNLRYTFLQMIGSVVFFNVMQIPLKGTVMEKVFFKGNFVDAYKENMIKIIKSGIEIKEN